MTIPYVAHFTTWITKTTLSSPSKFISPYLTYAALKDYTTFSLNSTLRTHLNTGQPKKPLTHFLQSQKQGLMPDRFTIPALIKLSLEIQESPPRGKQFHAFAIKSCYIDDLVITTVLIKMYFKCGCLDAPCRLFDEIPQRDVILFNTMICGCSQSGHGSKAFHFFSKMLEERIEPNRITIPSLLSVCSQLREVNSGRMLHGFCFRSGLLDKADVILQTALVDMYSKCGNLACARSVFDRMTKKTLVPWNSIINACFFDGSFEVALVLFKEMVSEGWFLLKSSILATVLNICGATTDLRKGKEVHGYILKRVNNSNDLDNLDMYNAILNMYVKTGSMESAILLFESLSRRNVVTWTIMISCYGAYGFSRKALQAFDEMKDFGVRPDGITFISILSACSHGGLVDEGQEVYNSMERDYHIVPDMMHFVCMVDLYGRAGLLDEAHDFIKMMPVKPDKFVWGALLSSCRNHKNLELGEYAARKALELDQHDIGIYLLLSRLYADSGRWESLAKVRSVMKEFGLKPQTACSWVEVKGMVYKFTVGDRLKAISVQIYEFLELLRMAMEKAGFMSDTSCVTHKIKENEKVNDLCGHTEKLALAFALMKGGNLIRIGKNLRVCTDCHSTFKFVSETYNKEIILKDPNRYHRFAQGCCSCGDFW